MSPVMRAIAIVVAVVGVAFVVLLNRAPQPSEPESASDPTVERSGPAGSGSADSPRPEPPVSTSRHQRCRCRDQAFGTDSSPCFPIKPTIRQSSRWLANTVRGCVRAFVRTPKTVAAQPDASAAVERLGNYHPAALRNLCPPPFDAREHSRQHWAWL